MLRSLGGGQIKKTHKNSGNQSQSFKNKCAMVGSLGGGQINKKHKNGGGQSKSCKNDSNKYNKIILIKKWIQQHQITQNANSPPNLRTFKNHYHRGSTL